MEVVGFDAKVAIANGYEVAYDSFGNASLADHPDVSAASGSAVSPFSIQNGNCGSSWIYLYNVGPKQFKETTGWAVISPAVSYKWVANMGGVTKAWGEGLLLRTSWEASWTGSVSQAGWYLASAAGTATLANGKVCAAKTPTDGETIY